jgi:hypothetical protein
VAAVEGAGIAFIPDWLAGPTLRAGKLVEVLPGWGSKGEGGVYAILPPGRLIPAKTRLFVVTRGHWADSNATRSPRSSTSALVPLCNKCARSLAVSKSLILGWSAEDSRRLGR